MDDEIALLIFELMFGGHQKREKADMGLRRCGVPAASIFECKHQGIRARANLKKEINRLLWLQRAQQNRKNPAGFSPFKTAAAKENWQRNTRSDRTTRHSQRTPSSSLQGFGFNMGTTIALASVGFFVEAGMVYDNFGKTGYISLGPAFGIDVSAEANMVVVKNENEYPQFRGEMLGGTGATYNLGVGPLNAAYGGDANPTSLSKDNTVRIPENFSTYELGISASPVPASGSINATNTYTFPMAPTFFGLILMPQPVWGF